MSSTNPNRSTASQRGSRVPPPSPSISLPSNSSTYSKPNPRQSVVSNLSSSTSRRSGAPPPPTAPPGGPPDASASHRRNPYAPEIRNSSTFFHPPNHSSLRASNGSRLGGYHGGYHRAPAGRPPIPIITTNLPPGAGIPIPFAHPPPFYNSSGGGGDGPGGGASSDDSPSHSPSPSPSPSPSHQRTHSFPNKKRGKRQGLQIDLASMPVTAKVGLWLMGTTPKQVAKAARQRKEWRAREREARWMRREARRVQLQEEMEREGGNSDSDGDEDEDERDGGEGGGGDGDGEGQQQQQQQQQGVKGGRRRTPPDVEGKEREEWEREFQRLGVRDD